MDAMRPPERGILSAPKFGGGCKAMVIVGVVVFGLVAVLGFAGCTRFKIIDLDENAKKAWGNVQSSYQRRADLIPNLVETIKGATDYEKGTYKEIVDAQNKLLGIHREFKELIKTDDPALIQKMYGDLVKAQSRFMETTTTAFPNLKAGETFQTLMIQIEGTENRIAVERVNYNSAVAVYNAKIRKWGWMPFCGGFTERKVFEADEGTDKAPKVNFGKERSG